MNILPFLFYTVCVRAFDICWAFYSLHSHSHIAATSILRNAAAVDSPLLCMAAYRALPSRICVRCFLTCLLFSSGGTLIHLFCVVRLSVFLHFHCLFSLLNFLQHGAMMGSFSSIYGCVVVVLRCFVFTVSLSSSSERRLQRHVYTISGLGHDATAAHTFWRCSTLTPMLRFNITNFLTVCIVFVDVMGMPFGFVAAFWLLFVYFVLFCTRTFR